MLARVRECRKLWQPVPRSHTSKLHFQDMTSSGSILVPFRCHVLRDLPLGSQCNGNIRTKVYRQIFSHHRVNFLRSEEPPVLCNVEQLHWKQIWTDVLIPSPKSMIEHILQNKIIKSFNYFSHRLTGIALMLSISLKLTNGMLRITFNTKFALVNFRKVECKPLIRRFVILIGSSQRTAFLNFVAG